MAFSNSSDLMSVFEKLPLRDELVWVEGLTGETAPELCFKSTVRKKMAAVHFTTIPCEPN